MQMATLFNGKHYSSISFLRNSAFYNNLIVKKKKKLKVKLFPLKSGQIK